MKHRTITVANLATAATLATATYVAPPSDHDPRTVDPAVQWLKDHPGPPTDANQHLVLTLDPASRTAVNAPDIDYLYHYC